MHFADSLHVQIHSWNRYYIRLLLMKWSCKVGIPRMDLDTEKIRETHNPYIESGSFKNIIKYKNYQKSADFKLYKKLLKS